MQIAASAFDSLVKKEANAVALLRSPRKYERWFFSGRNGSLWLMDTNFYMSVDYPGGLCVVFVHGHFPKYDIGTGAWIKGAWIKEEDDFGYPSPEILTKYHGEEVEIVSG